jgi:hypothetical protein
MYNEGNALGIDSRPQSLRPEGAKQDHGPSVRCGWIGAGPFRAGAGAGILGLIGGPRALPWAFLCRPFRAVSHLQSPQNP